MPAVIKYACRGVEGSYLRWTTLCAYSLHCCCVCVEQSTHNGVLFNGLESRTNLPVALVDIAWLSLNLHTLKMLQRTIMGSMVPIGGGPVAI